MPASLLFLAFTLSASRAVGTDTVRKDRVAALDGMIEPGETETWPGSHPPILVYFTDGSLAIAAGGGNPSVTRVKRGEAVFVESPASQAGVYFFVPGGHNGNPGLMRSLRTDTSAGQVPHLPRAT